MRDRRPSRAGPTPGTSAPARAALLSAFSSLVGAQVVAALLGYLYWVVAAHGMAPPEIGAAYASVAAMTLLGALAVLGHGTLLVGELPGRPADEQRVILGHSMLVVGAAGALLGVVWAVIGPYLGHTFERAVGDPASAALFVCGVAGTAIGLMLDQAVLGLGRPGAQVTRNLVASGCKFPLILVLVLAGSGSHLAVLVAWVLPLGLSELVLWRRLGLRRAAVPFEPLTAHLRRYARPALLNHAVNVSLGASSLFVPMIAAAVLDAHDYASFSLAWLVATFVFIPPYMLAVALFATSVGDVSTYRAQARSTLPIGLAVGALCYAGAAALGGPIMATFGARYQAEGATILRIVALGVLALVVKDHLFALHRVREQMVSAAVIAVAGLSGELTGAALGAVVAGPTGLGVGWVIALYVQALWMGPIVLRALRSP